MTRRYPWGHQSRVLRACLRWLIGGFVRRVYRVHVSGTQHLPKDGPFLVIANHHHIFDPVAIQPHVRPWVYWVAKRELFDLPVVGWIIKTIGTIPFQRDTLDVTALRTIVSVVKNRQVIGIFPQGRRVDEEARNRCMPKAATATLARKCGLLVVPCGLKNGYHLLGPHRPQVVFGEPFTVDETMTVVDMMRRVYDLIGLSYDPVPPETEGATP